MYSFFFLNGFIFIFNHMLRQQKPLSITLAPSRSLVFLFGLLALFTSVCLHFCPISAGLIVFFSFVACILCGYMILLHALLKLENSWVSLRLNAKNQWFAQSKKGEEVEVDIAHDTFIATFLTVINLQDKKGKSFGCMLVIPSRVNQAAFRQLRVRLLWGERREKTQTDSVETLENAT
jgi:hypothetical protein